MALAFRTCRARAGHFTQGVRQAACFRHRNRPCPVLRGDCTPIMTTLATGTAGFMESRVTRQLGAAGDDVGVLMRPSSTNRAIADLSLEYVTGDLRDVASLDRAMKGVKRIFHVAADYRLWAKHTQDIYDSNVGGTKN